MIILYLLMLGFALFAVGISGVALSRHFLVIMFSVEIMLVAATLAAVSLLGIAPEGNILLLLFAVWAIAAAEVSAFVALYRHLARIEPDLDVTRLPRNED